jgi:hypothetical protein
MADICAVRAASADTARALESQIHTPDAVVVYGDSLVATLRRALDTEAQWIWILDGSAAPRADALHALLDGLARADGFEQPQLLTGIVRTPDGRLDSQRGLWYRRGHIEPAMAAARRRLLPVRAAAGPVLVHRDALRAVPPRTRTELSPAGLLDLTARILRTRVGYLVPESVSEAPAPMHVVGASTAARFVLGDAFLGLDRLRIGYELLLRGAGSESPQPAP